MTQFELSDLTCPACGHLWRRHDPEDGACDAHSDEPGMFGPCRCGREVEFTAAANARLSKAALDREIGVDQDEYRNRLHPYWVDGDEFDERGINRFPITMPAACECGDDANHHAIGEKQGDPRYCSQCECVEFKPVAERTGETR